MKTYKYTAEMADGRIETFSIPRFFDPKEIAERLYNSLVFLHIDKKMAVYAVGYLGKLEEVFGPAVVMIVDLGRDNRREYYKVPNAPKDAGESFNLWKEYAPRAA